MDPDGSSNYSDIGTLEMMTVPYAFYAEKVGDVNDADADPQNEIQRLGIQGEVLSISGGNSVQMPDASTTNELQELNFSDSNNLLSISGGNTIQLPALSSQWKENGQAVYLEPGRVGIGLSSPPHLLSLYGQDNATMNFLTSTSGSGQKDGFALGLNRLSHSAMLWNYEAGDIRLGTNNETRLYINQFGRVGIGTTAPGERLEVSGEAGDVGVRIKAGEGQTARLSLMEDHTNNYGFSWQYNGVDKNVFLRSHGFRNDSDDQLISVAGNGAIEFATRSVRVHGGDGDDAILSVTHADYGTSALHLGLRNGTPLLDFYSNPLQIRAENRLALAIDDDSGYVGIGTNNPNVELDVRGDVEISKELTVKQRTTVEGALNVKQNTALEGSLAVKEETKVDGFLTIGGGASINQIQEFTGTTTSTGNNRDFPYPSGYNRSNTRILCLQIQFSTGNWGNIGVGDIEILHAVLFENYIRIIYPPKNDYQGRPFRILLLRIGK